MIINFIKCKIKGHKLIFLGPCPYTQKNYDLCRRCDAVIETIEKENND
jgi:hypothetical protein